MLFNSPVYIFLFLPVVVALYWVLNASAQERASKYWLVAASLFFYSYWNPIYLPLILSSILVNFTLGRKLQLSFQADTPPSEGGRKLFAIIGVIFNVSLLGYFKYADFFITNLNFVSGAEFDPLNIVLPLAISFFTFQQIAYIIDCYKEKTRVYGLLDYMLFVSFFPQLIAGPIVHHKQMMPQFMSSEGRRLQWGNIAMGITVFSMGLFKKVFIADTFAVWANAGFGSEATLGFFEAWGATLSYTFQLYYDFSGYTDMAIGAALLFNIRLPINFNSPYKALSIQDFWRRWHITLSNWLKDYVYIPLGGNRSGESRTLVNLFLTFLIGGLWHGAGWTFVIWGALHGGALVIHRLWSKLNISLPAAVSWFLTFMFVNFAWVFFRAESVDSAMRMIKALVSLDGITFSASFAEGLSRFLPIDLADLPISTAKFVATMATLEHLLIFMSVALIMPNTMQIIDFVRYQGRFKFQYSWSWSLVGPILFFVACLSFVGNAAPAQFLYFNF